MRERLLIVLVILAVAGSAPAGSEEAVKAPDKPTTAPAPVAATTAPAAPAAGASLKVTVVSVSGPAQKMIAGDEKAKWQPMKAGEVLDEMTVIRTGFGAKVVLKFEDRGQVTVNNATKVGLSELRKEGARASANIGLKYGTVRASVDGKQGNNDFRVSTPRAVLSIKGSTTDVCSMGDSPKVAQTHTGRFSLMKQQVGLGLKPQIKQMNLTGGQTGGSSFIPPIILSSTKRASQARITNFGMTPADIKTVVNNTTGRRGAGPPSVTGNSTIPSKLPPSLPPGEPGFP